MKRGDVWGLREKLNRKQVNGDIVRQKIVRFRLGRRSSAVPAHKLSLGLVGQAPRAILWEENL